VQCESKLRCGSVYLVSDCGVSGWHCVFVGGEVDFCRCLCLLGVLCNEIAEWLSVEAADFGAGECWVVWASGWRHSVFGGSVWRVV
jgi:hypothetical protein